MRVAPKLLTSLFKKKYLHANNNEFLLVKSEPSTLRKNVFDCQRKPKILQQSVLARSGEAPG